MSSRASQWPCPQPSTTASTRWRLVKSTTAYGHRRRTRPGRLRTKLYGDRRSTQPGKRCSSSEPRPQERVQRHTMEHIVDFVCCAPMVQILDAPVPQTVEQLPDVLRFFDRLTAVPEQVIEVPKILPEEVPMRAVLRDPQLAEQLVEVPTIVSYSWLQLRLEQNDDIPVEAFKIFAQDRVHPLRTSQLVFQMLWMSLVNGFFRTFHSTKKVRRRVRTRVRECPLVLALPRRLLSSVFVSRSGSWSRMNMGSTTGTWTLGRSAGNWKRAPILAGGGEMASTLTLATTDNSEWLWVLVRGVAQTVLGCCWSVLEAFWKNFIFFVPLCRAIRTWKSGLCLCPRFFQPWSGVWVLPVEHVVFSGRVRCLVQQWIHYPREF